MPQIITIILLTKTVAYATHYFGKHTKIKVSGKFAAVSLPLWAKR